MLLLLLEAHTVQNLSLKDWSDELAVFAGVEALGESSWPSRAEGLEEEAGDSVGGGGGSG